MSEAAITKDHEMLQNLSDKQRRAILLLVEGKRDAEVASEVGVTRETITRWRLYHPGFQAALNEKRRQLWDEAGDRLGVLAAEALNTLARQLSDEQRALSAAVALLRLAGVSRLGWHKAPTEFEALVKDRIDAQDAEMNRIATRALSPAERQAEAENPRKRLLRESLQRFDATHRVMKHLRSLCEREEEQEAARRDPSSSPLPEGIADGAIEQKKSDAIMRVDSVPVRLR